MNFNNFEDFPLHDAILYDIKYSWEEKICTIYISAFLDLNQNAVDCTMTFTGVTLLEVKQEQPWGFSFYINGQKFIHPNEYIIEIQSGDNIRLIAGAVELKLK